MIEFTNLLSTFAYLLIYHEYLFQTENSNRNRYKTSGCRLLFPNKYYIFQNIIPGQLYKKYLSMYWKFLARPWNFLAKPQTLPVKTPGIYLATSWGASTHIPSRLYMVVHGWHVCISLYLIGMWVEAPQEVAR